MRAVDENHIESVEGFLKERIGVDVLNPLDVNRLIYRMFAPALYSVEVLAAHSNANLKVASVLSMANETIDQFSSGHKRSGMGKWVAIVIFTLFAVCGQLIAGSKIDWL
jgi:hypothetical protein